MHNKINLPSMTKNDSTGILEYHFTLPDKTVSIKTLKELITELGQPNIAVFTDASFTVGRTPILYRKVDTEWEELFKFVACQIVDVAATVKGDKGSKDEL